MAGTEITCRDFHTGDSEAPVIQDAWPLITDGSCYLDGIQAYANGTVVVTIKRKAA